MFELADLGVWERLWAPYDQPIYDFVLTHLRADDVVLDIGAGDLRLARQMAQIVKHVYALEVNPALNVLNRINLPANATLIESDARYLPFPDDISCGVLLMRHCTYFEQYCQKLILAGASRLFTNARWGMGIECVNLLAEPLFYEHIPPGWYACRCGSIGFKPGPADLLTTRSVQIDYEVSSCPVCDTLE